MGIDFSSPWNLYPSPFIHHQHHPLVSQRLERNSLMGSSQLSFSHFGCYPNADPNLYDSYFCMSNPRIKLPNFTLELQQELKRAGDKAIPVNAREFYNDIFQDDLQEKRKSIHEEYEKGKYSGIFIEIEQLSDKAGKPIYHEEGKYKGHRVTKSRNHLFFKGNKELYHKIDYSDNFIITNGISYVGKRRLQKNVAKMYAMAIEIDGIKGLDGVRQLIHTWHRPVIEMDGKKFYTMTPQPTYITCSGRGLHLYFVFEEPIDLYPNIFEELSRVRKRWVDLFWNSRVTKMSDKNSIQYETLTQGFRAVGSKTRLDDTYVLAFKTGEKHTLESLNEILSEDDKIKIGYKSKMSLEEAKKRYPDWYQRRIVEGQKKSSEDFVFHRHRGIYDNWKQKIISGATVGKRFYCLENLCSLAVQCCISPEELEADCKVIMEHFETLTDDDKNHFTLSDVISALATYHRNDTSAFTRKIEFISERTGIPLQRAKRNGNTRAEHVEIMNFTRQLKGRKDSKYLGGRPDKRAIVQEWRKNNPLGKKVDCQKETGLARNTISKYW